MPPPPTPSPSTSNIMPPPSGSNTIPPPPTQFVSNTMSSHATLGSNTSAGSNTMPSHDASASTRTNKIKCPSIPKKRDKPAKSSASSSRGGSRGGSTGGATIIGGSRGGACKRGRCSSKKGGGSNNIPLQGLRDKSLDEEECARKFDHVEAHRAQDKDEPLQVGADLPTKENTVEANPKPTRYKKSKEAEDPNQMRIFHKNRGRSERIFNQKMKNFKFDEHGSGSTPDKAFDVE
nr:pectin lyase-like superfamily protein [Tanacetum cinerariifolium]